MEGISQPQKVNKTPTKEKSIQEVVIKSVEELIPNIKPKLDKNEQTLRSGSRLEDNFTLEFMNRYIMPLTVERDKKLPEFLDCTLSVLKDRFKDKIFVDLGAGDREFGFMISKILGAKSYIGVEKFNGNLLETTLSGIKFKKQKHQEKENLQIPEVAVENDDMLSFLKRLPDNSVNVFMSGIDQNVIGNPKYTEFIKKEIERVISKEGCYLVFEGLYPKNLVNLFEKLKEANTGFLSMSFLLRNNHCGVFIQPQDLDRSKEKYAEEIAISRDNYYTERKKKYEEQT
jgi:hypothetical protein